MKRSVLLAFPSLNQPTFLIQTFNISAQNKAMSKLLFKILSVSAFFLVLSFSANAQTSEKNAASKTLNIAKKTGVIVVGGAAKFGFKATKFTATKVAKPIVVKSAPAVGKFMLKKSGYTVKKSPRMSLIKAVIFYC